MKLFLDTSALVNLFHEEEGTKYITENSIRAHQRG